MMRLPQPLTGFAAFKKCIERIYPDGSTAWFKFSHDKFFTGFAQTSGEFGIWATEGGDTDRKKKDFIPDAYSFLSKLSKSKPGGVFYLPGKPTEFPLKDYCFAASDIGAEMDDGTTEEQWQRVEWFATVSSLEPGLIIGSGGKSIHGHWFLDSAIPIAEATYLKKLVAIALLSDPTIVSPHQPMRIAGFHRWEKGREQTLDYWSDCRYTQEQFLQGLRAAFGAKGYVFPEYLSGKRWRRIRQVLASKELTSEVKSSQIKEILALDETVFHPKPPQYDRPHDFKYLGDRIPLEICLTKDDRELVARGVGEGSRTVSGFKLAVNLVATASYLDSKRIAYESDPRQLFDEFCARCSPALSAHESEEIWRSANRNNPTPSLSDDAIQNCIVAWQTRQNPQPSKQRDRTLNADKWQARFGFPDWLKSIGKISKRLAYKGFGKLSQSKKPLPQTINYAPGELPTRAEYVLQGSPKIIFAPGQRLTLLQEAVEKGFHDILDSSHPGTHKTTDAGNASPAALAVKKLWNFTQQSRNPATPSIEQNYTPLAVRNDGFVTDKERKTPMGSSHLRWPQNGETADTTGNCFRTKEFRSLAAKNVPNIEGKMNPICGSCHMLRACQQGDAPGASFRGERRESLTPARISANLQSAPLPSDYTEYASSGAFIDEAMHNLDPIRSLAINWADYSRAMDALEQELPLLHADLKPVRDVLSPVLRRQVREPHYGFSDADVLDMLGDISDIAEVIPQVIDWESNLDDLDFLEEEPDGIDIKFVEKEFKNAARFASKTLRRQSYRDVSTQLDSVAVRWLSTFLLLWQRTEGDWQRGSFRIKDGELTLHWRDRRHADLAKAMKWVCYQDATATRHQLALTQDIDPKTILHIQHTSPDYSNLRIVQVTGLGLLGKQRSDSAEHKVESLKRALVKQHPGIGFIDWKSPRKGEFKEGFWFADSRSTNRYANAPALSSFGIPYPNLGELQALYQTLTGRCVNLDHDELDAEFQEFVNTHVQSEIIQTAGRLRSHLRPDEHLPYYFVGDYDLDFLKQAFPGALVEEVKASDITLDVCDTMERNLLGILRGLSTTAAQGIKQTQAAIAQFGEITQGQVSKILAQVGGLPRLQKIFQTLYRSPIAFGIISELSSDEQFFCRKFLTLVLQETEEAGEPEQLVAEVSKIIKICGMDRWRRMVAALPGEVHIALVTQIIRLFPDEWKQRLGELLEEGGVEWSLT